MAKRTPETDRKRKIEEAKKKQRADERRRTALAIVLASLLGVGLVGATIYMEQRSKENENEPAAALDTLGVPEAEAGCTPVQSKEKIPEGSNHQNGPVQYTEVPPDSGPHSSATLRNLKKFYSRDEQPQVEQAVHNLEHGLVVAWYDKSLPEDQVKILEEASRSAGPRYVAVPWDRGDFPDNKHFVLTAWGHRQACEKVSGKVMDAFIKGYADKDAPEKGAGV